MNSRVKTLVIFAAVVALCSMTAMASQKHASVTANDLAFDAHKPEVTSGFVYGKAPMQGGDTCAEATVIPSLPYSTTGTTVGYAHDYNEVCPFSTPGSPDVVYAYTPAADEAVDITLCANSAYDTKVYVYGGVCPDPGNPIACNDDACSTPSYPSSYVSEVTGVNLTGGTTYYIVIDGYGSGQAGDYTLDITVGVPPAPGPDCTPYSNVVYGQPGHAPTDSWSFATSSQAAWIGGYYYVAENFPNSDYNVSAINVFGLSLINTGSWAACDPTGMTFDMTFYSDSAGQPNTADVLCTYDGIAATITPYLYMGAAVQYAGFDSYLYGFDLSGQTCDLTGVAGNVWVGIYNEPMTPDCAFMFGSGTGGDFESYQDQGAGTWVATGFDRHICVSAGASVQGTLDGSLAFVPDLMGTDPSGFLIEVLDGGGAVVDSALTDGMGYYSFSLAPGTYSVDASNLDWLGGTYVGAVVTDGGTTTLPAPTLLGGDFDDSGDVGVVDVTYVASRFGGGDLTADINRSGAVDLVDVTSTASNYGSVAPVPWP